MTKQPSSIAVRFGVDRLVNEHGPVPRSARIGLVTNDAATTADGRSSRRALRDAGYHLVRLFSPEHGLGARAEDGAAISDESDTLTGLPVVSLYGHTMRPSPESLADLDAVLFDIPDVGARFYTYIWTLSHVLEACATADVPLVVLDRPNPIGGELASAEGPVLDESFVSSFVGRWSMPIRHSLTVGELASLWNRQRRIGAKLEVISLTGWRRAMHWPDTGLPFVPTSPAIRDYETALLYPGTCLIEGTNLSEGRGTDLPFRLIGAPWLDAEAIAEELNARIPSIRAMPTRFTPNARKYAGVDCRGVRIDLLSPKQLRPVRLGLHLVAAAIRHHPGEFSWTPYPTAANESGGGHFDRLVGRPIREALATADASRIDDYITRWTTTEGWDHRVRDALLYE